MLYMPFHVWPVCRPLPLGAFSCSSLCFPPVLLSVFLFAFVCLLILGAWELVYSFGFYCAFWVFDGRSGSCILFLVVDLD